MLSKIAITAILLGAAVAKPGYAPVPQYDIIQIRQAASAYPTECIPPSSILDILTGIPTPPAAVESELAGIISTVSDPCDYSLALTGADLSGYASYTSALLSYLKPYESELLAFDSTYIANCGGSAIGYSAPVCTAVATSAAVTTDSGSSAASTTDSASETGSGSGSSSTSGGSSSASGTSASGNGSPHQTGLVAAAGLVAGVIGVVAAL
jgi:uncharacterized membrane protein YgcG